MAGQVLTIRRITRAILISLRDRLDVPVDGQGRPVRFSPDDRRVWTWLQRGTPLPLLSERPTLRTFFAARLTGGLLQRSSKSIGRLQRRIIVWLSGKSGSRLAIGEISRLATDRDVRLRREVARALQRLEAWTQLEAMHNQDSDPRVRRLAATRQPVPFDQRLREYSRLPAAVPGKQRRPGSAAGFFYRHPLGPGRPPKSPAWIRRLLERIRAAVRGEPT